MGTDFAEINGYRLRYRLEGAGPLAVFGHGLMGSMEQIDENQPEVAKLYERVRLLVYDARGHGQSEGPADSAAYTWETMGRDMSAFAAFAAEERAIFGGASMGAAAALWVALEQPERVRALVLMMPPPLGGPRLRGPEEQQAIGVLDMLSAAVQNFGLEQTVELAKAFPGFAATPAQAEERARWMMRQSPLALGYAIRGLIDAPFHDPEAYTRITAPTLVLAHEGDGLHPLRSAQLLADCIPGARMVVGDNPDYWRQHPAHFLSEVGAFLDGIEATA